MRFVAAAILGMLWLGACGSDAPAGDGVKAISFGAQDEKCDSTKLRNELDDQPRLEAATNCFLAEVEAGNPIVIDIDQPTVEGDSVLLRYAFDGESFLLVQDTRLDTFGAGSVDAQRCQSVKPTGWLPDGVDCEPIDHPGFIEASS